MLGIMPETRPVPVESSRGLSFRDIVFVLFRRKWVILAVALPIIAVGTFSITRQTSDFLASSTVLVELRKPDLPVWNTDRRTLDLDRELSTMFNIAMSVPVGDMAAAALMDSLPVIQEEIPRLRSIEEPSQLRDYLLGNVDVSVVGESTILDFRTKSASPRVSLMAAGALTDAFIRYQVHGRKSRNAVAYYDEQIRSVRAEVDSLLELRSQVLEAAGYSSLEAEMRYDAGQLADLNEKLRDAAAQRISLELSYEQLKGMLAGDPLDFPVGMDESRSYNLVYWRNTVAKHQESLNATLAVHTEGSIPVKRQREVLAKSIERLRREETAYVESLRLELEALRAKEGLLREQADEVRGRNMRAPEAYRQVSLVDVEIESLRKVLQELQGKRGEVRLSTLADERVSSVVQLTAPELVENIAGSKSGIYVVIILIMSLGLGVVAGFVAENMDHRVYAPADVEDHLKLPVFASITKVE